MEYAARARFCKNVLAEQLLLLMAEKKTNLAVSLDVTHAQQLLEFASLLGDEICVLKTHIDILTDFSLDCVYELSRLAEKHHFLLFEDRKFADIGNTVKQQYQHGMYHIADWAHIINAHALPGPGIIEGLRAVGLEKSRGLLLLAEMSSVNNLFTTDYTKKTIALANQFPDFVIGFIAQRKLSNDPHWIVMTPGVQINATGDTLGQHYILPETAILEQQSDVIIVGRGILQAKDPLLAAKKYRERGWEAYLKTF